MSGTVAYVDSLVQETDVGCIKLLQKQTCTVCCDCVKSHRDGF
jgi:hypothetical protein